VTNAIVKITNAFCSDICAAPVHQLITLLSYRLLHDIMDSTKVQNPQRYGGAHSA